MDIIEHVTKGQRRAFIRAWAHAMRTDYATADSVLRRVLGSFTFTGNQE